MQTLLDELTLPLPKLEESGVRDICSDCLAVLVHLEWDDAHGFLVSLKCVQNHLWASATPLGTAASQFRFAILTRLESQQQITRSIIQPFGHRTLWRWSSTQRMNEEDLKNLKISHTQAGQSQQPCGMLLNQQNQSFRVFLFGLVECVARVPTGQSNNSASTSISCSTSLGCSGTLPAAKRPANVGAGATGMNVLDEDATSCAHRWCEIMAWERLKCLPHTKHKYG